MMVQNLREQKLVVLSSRISMGWGENRDIWKTMGVPYSAKHQYVRQHPPQSSKALKVMQRSQVCQSQAQALSWNLPLWGMWEDGWDVTFTTCTDLRRNHRAINK